MPTLPSRRRLLSTLLGGAAGQALSARAPIPVLVPADVLRDFQAFLGGRRAEQLTSFAGAHSRRDVVELALLHLALAEGRREAGLALQPVPTAARLHRELSQAHAACSGTSFWRQDFPADERRLLFSVALLQEGEFEAGLYTAAGNRRALAARSLADVLALKAMCNRDWRVDWQSLEQLGLRDIQHVGNWELMPRMLASGRADFVLAPFQPTPDLALEVGGVRLVPIPGLKVALQGTRHYLLSAQHEGAPELKQRLDAGLASLHARGLVRRAYVGAGFINAAVAAWSVLPVLER